MVRVTGFDHVVFVVADVERSLAWYCGFLGLEGVRVDEWRARQGAVPPARLPPTAVIDFVARGDGDSVGRNVDHICLVVEPADLRELGEPGPRFGAQGMGTSVYLTDPDGNTVELRHY